MSKKLHERIVGGLSHQVLKDEGEGFVRVDDVVKRDDVGVL